MVKDGGWESEGGRAVGALGGNSLDVRLREGDVGLMFGVGMVLGKVGCAWLG